MDVEQICAVSVGDIVREVPLHLQHSSANIFIVVEVGSGGAVLQEILPSNLFIDGKIVTPFGEITVREVRRK